MEFNLVQGIYQVAITYQNYLNEEEMLFGKFLVVP
jgi:hypothetical protein